MTASSRVTATSRKIRPVVYAALACAVAGIVALPVPPSLAALILTTEQFFSFRRLSPEEEWLNETARIMGWIGLVLGGAVCCLAAWMWRSGGF